MYKIIWLSLGMFALGLDAYVIAGIIPQISADFQVSASLVGQSVTLFTFCYAISTPLFTTLLANQPVKKILLAALLLFTVANIASALANNITILLLSRAFAGIGAGIFSPLATSCAASLVSSEKKGRALGFILLGMSCGTVIGVPLGIFISDYYSWHSTLWLVVLLGIIGLAGISSGLHTIRAPVPPSLRERVAMLTDKNVVVTVLVTIFTAIASLGLYTYIAAILQDHTATHPTTYSALSLIWTWGIGGVIGAFGIGTCIDKIKNSSAILLTILIIMTLSLLALNFISLLGGFIYIAILLWGATGWASLAPQQHVLLTCQPKHSAAVLGLNSSCNYLGGALGSLLGGVLLAGGIHASQLPLYAGVTGIIALLIQMVIVLKKRRKSFN